MQDSTDDRHDRAWPRGDEKATAFPYGSIALAILIALLARLPFFATSDFPLGDGGMFYTMTNDLQAAGYALPSHTTYNHLDIPYTYPPLSFYLAALLDDALGIDVLDTIRLLPLVMGLLCLVPAFVLYRSLMPDGSARVATLVLGLMPMTAPGLIVGGGLSRTTAVFFALCALAKGRQLVEDPTARRVAWCIVLSSLAALSHLESAVLVLHTFALLWLVFGRQLRALPWAGVIAAGVALLTLPWWGVSLSRHGLAPFLAAGQTGGWSWRVGEPLLSLLLLKLTTEPTGLLAVLALIGAAAALVTRSWFLPLWVVAILFFNARKSSTYTIVPLAGLVAMGLTHVLIPRLTRLLHQADRARHRRPSQSAGKPPSLAQTRSLAAAGCIGYVVVFGLLSCWSYYGSMSFPLQSLAKSERDAMEWVRDPANTPADSRFLVVSAFNTKWGADYVAEWFPALADRRSVSTPQGAEWLPPPAYEELVRRYKVLNESLDTVEALDAALDELGIEISHVLVAKPDADPARLGRTFPPVVRDTGPIVRMLSRSTRYERVYDGDGAVVFRVRSGGQSE